MPRRTRFATNVFRCPPVPAWPNRRPGLRRGDRSTSVLLKSGGVQAVFKVLRVEVPCGDDDAAPEPFVHLHFTVDDEETESECERAFWFRVVDVFWSETHPGMDSSPEAYSEAEKREFRIQHFRCLIALALGRRSSAFEWGRPGIRDERRFVDERGARGVFRAQKRGDGVVFSDPQDGQTPGEDLREHGRTALLLPWRGVHHVDYRRRFRPGFFRECHVMQLAALDPDRRTAGGQRAYKAYADAAKLGPAALARCEKLAARHTGDREKDRDLWFEAIAQRVDRMRRSAEDVDRAYLRFLQADLDLALQYAYAHVANWLIGTPEVLESLDDRSRSYNYLAHSQQYLLFDLVPALHPFWHLCLRSPALAKVIVEVAPKLIAADGRTLDPEGKSEAAGRLSNLLFTAQSVYWSLIRERPKQKKGGVPGAEQFFDAERAGGNPAEEPDDDDDHDAGRDGVCDTDGDSPRGKTQRGPTEGMAEVLAEEPQYSAKDAWTYDGDADNIPDPAASDPQESVARRELLGVIEEMANTNRDIAMLLARERDGLSVKECAAKYGCSEGTVSKRVARGRAAILQLRDDDER